MTCSTRSTRSALTINGCEWEWQKAVQNQTFGDRWMYWFGPYISSGACPGCRTSGAKGWGYAPDTLRRRTGTRDTWIDHDGTWKLWVRDMISVYPGGDNETDKSLGLSAPKDTSLQYESDKDFCSSGRAYNDWGTWRCR